MEEQKPIFPIALKWSIILAALMTILSVVSYVLDLSGNRLVGLLTWGLIIVTLFMGIRDYRESNGTMTFGQGLGTGILIGFLGGLFGAIFSYVFFAFIAPDAITDILELAEEEMVRAGNTDDEIDQAMSLMKPFMTPTVMAITSLVSTVFFSFVTALIAALILKKEH